MVPLRTGVDDVLMRIPRLLVGFLAVGAVAVTPASAQLPSAPQKFDVQVMAINGPTSVFAPCGIGGTYSFPTIPGSTVGQVWNAEVNLSTTPWTIGTTTLTDKPPCITGGGPPGAPPGFSPPPGGFKPGQTFGPGLSPPPGFDGEGFGEEFDEFAPVSLAGELPGSAFNRVVTFRCDADGFGDGELSVTIRSIGGLPKGLRQDFNEAVDDQDGLVLVGRTARVYKNGERVGKGKLDDADGVAVKGKLLRPGQWREDEDGNPIPTIRAKRVTITG